jgi:hypothetical protein
LGDLIAEHRIDSQGGKNTQLPLADLFRQSICRRVAGYRVRMTPSGSHRLGVPADRVLEGLGPWCGVDFLVADRRDRNAGGGRELSRPGAQRSRTRRPARGPGWSWTWIRPRSRCTANKRTALKTATSNPLATYWLLLAENGLTQPLFGATVRPDCHLTGSHRLGRAGL